MMNPFLQVAIGGAVGSVARYSVGRLVGAGGLPLATLIVNVLGSFAMGLLAAALAHRGGSDHAPLLLTGFLGGFTTFSAFSLDTLTLIERGQGVAAAGYVAASVGLSLVAVIGGLALGRGLFA
ncbi:MAG: fluoride efflux transporter CrcB [Paracoccus sp. (in: a-proteobacteria)]|uniref:fluoride efflux transporter CrcB n=1 Tax=Paracoccus sp. TaxID=267 RepID=UPI0026DEFCFC|nr:fluoride efflux transporter CrcB [Paracoccus sp. (in: a-proteobacteria)]MDO5613601.1 fluoride efflux transporter CrcB [Paracoccus sp. (in: a-proteobacteria)]